MIYYGYESYATFYATDPAYNLGVFYCQYAGTYRCPPRFFNSLYHSGKCSLVPLVKIWHEKPRYFGWSNIVFVHHGSLVWYGSDRYSIVLAIQIIALHTLIMNYDALHLDPDEHVIMEVRKHWIVFAGHGVGLFVSALLPFVVFTVLQMFVPSITNVIQLPGNTGALFLFFYSLWLLFLWISFFVAWTKYYLDVWFVTEKRIVAVDQKELFDREISNLRFDKIQDVTIDVDGLIPTMLHFGNIKVQTASEDEKDFAMDTVRNPDEVRRVIFSQHNEIGDVGLKQGIRGSV